MRIKAILFDLYGTLIDIETDESMEKIYRGISRFLIYQGINVRWQNLRDLYYGIMQEQLLSSSEQYPEPIHTAMPGPSSKQNSRSGWRG